MAGNVREWTSSLFKPYPYIQNDGREDLKSTENGTLRGGSWGDDARITRAACRLRYRSGTFTYLVGFRLAFAPGAGSS
jgi:formylglycine-generating enzyme required for sulfatase activity